MSQRARNLKLIYLTCSLLVVVSFAPSPQEVKGAWDGSSMPISFIALFLRLSPIYPLLLILISLKATFTYSAIKLRMASIVVLIGGLFFTLIIAAVGGPGADVIIINGVSVSIAIILSIMLFSSKPRVGMVSVAGGLIVLATSVWSLITAGSVLYQAAELANKNPYCIAHHSSYSADQRTLAFSDLRGSKLFTTKTGYKSTSNWYFHAVLIVKQDQGNIFYNWSPRHMKFNVIPNEELLIEPVRYSCVPMNEFISTMKFI